MATRPEPVGAASSESSERIPEKTERSRLLATCQQLLGRGRDLGDEEIIFWRGYLKQFTLEELRYAFTRWMENADWFPRPKDIRELVEAYRRGEAEKCLPIGCDRCNWTGFYEVRRDSVMRVVSECPCRSDPCLRTKDTRKPATKKDLAAVAKAWQEWGKKI